MKPVNPIFFSETYHNKNAGQVWEGLASEPGFAFLDSSDPKSVHSSKSILGIRPFLRFSSTKEGVALTWRNGQNETRAGNPFDVLDTVLQAYRVESPLLIPGGAIGYVSYDASRYLADFSSVQPTDLIPDLFFNFYDVVLVIDHAKGDISIQGQGLFEDSHALFLWLDSYIKQGSFAMPLSDFSVHNPQMDIHKETYLNTIEKIKTYIEKGDVYQVNFSYRHRVGFTGALTELYRRLRSGSPAPFSAYLALEGGAVLSTSPERFVRLDGRRILTSPIKGTRPRFGDSRDPSLQQELLTSEKDNAELLMIVDLERNDLNAICKTGTVHVPCLKRLEQFEHVIHLVADVEGELRDDVSHIRAFQTLFPGGSITGAPKIRAVDIISELEAVPRALYTGCIGYFSFSDRAEFNIAIRSLYANEGQIYFHTGGGIVADSDGDLEWEESRAKAKGVLLVLGIKETV